MSFIKLTEIKSNGEVSVESVVLEEKILEPNPSLIRNKFGLKMCGKIALENIFSYPVFKHLAPFNISSLAVRLRTMAGSPVAEYSVRVPGKGGGTLYSLLTNSTSFLDPIFKIIESGKTMEEGGDKYVVIEEDAKSDVLALNENINRDGMTQYDCIKLMLLALEERSGTLNNPDSLKSFYGSSCSSLHDLASSWAKLKSRGQAKIKS